VVDKKIQHDKQTDIEQKIRDEVKKENKYHLVQNYNNDLIRRSLKSQTNQNRLNIKEKKPNVHLENITKKIEEKQKKKMAGQPSTQMKSLGNQHRDDLRLEMPIQSDSVDKLLSKERGTHKANGLQVVSSSLTPNGGVALTYQSYSNGAKKKPKDGDTDTEEKRNQRLKIKNSLMQKIKKRNPSKASSRSNQCSAASKDADLSRSVAQAEPQRATMGKYPLADEHLLQLIAGNGRQGGSSHKAKDETDSMGLNDNKSHRQSTGSNNSNFYSNKLRNVRKAVSIINKDLDKNIHETKGRKDTHQPLKPAGAHYGQPLLTSIQNKNVLTLTQNLLQKRQKND
jgi:hypothetical protein